MKKKEGTNRQLMYHKEHGLFSNIIYIFRQMLKYEPCFLMLIPLGVLTTTVMKYLWTFISKFVIDLITKEQSERNLCSLIVVLFGIQLIITVLDTLFANEVFWRYIHTRFEMMYDKNMKIMQMAYQHLENQDVMDCYMRADNACNTNKEGIEGMMHAIVNCLIYTAIVWVGFFILGTVNPVVVLIMTSLAVINFFIQNYANRKTKRNVWDKLAIWRRKHAYIQNTACDFSAAKEIRMYSLQNWLVEKYQSINQVKYNAQKQNEKILFSATFSYNFLWAVTQVCLYLWLLYGVIYKKMTIGSFTLYVASATTLFENLKKYLFEITNLLARNREVDDFRSFLEFDLHGKDDGEELVPMAEQYVFSFRNVSFKYPKSNVFALKNLNLTIESGKRLAVVGLNGAGKSTMIKLLLRLYEPTEGEILLNGVNVKKYEKQSYYRIFAPVFQDAQMFSFSIKENISMKPTKETNDTLVMRTLVDSGMGKKVNELKKGIDTELLKVLYDDGIDLSGGEKQKIALARALYKNAPVVVLDEPTSAFDALAESQLYRDFDKLIGEKTAVYISHRLSSTQFCSNIAMFQNGEMVEYGTHKQLMEQGGIYAELFNLQAQYYKETSGKEVYLNG